MKVYIAAPLFNDAERWFNLQIDQKIRECGHETFLPQRDGGCVAEMPDFINGKPKHQALFEMDCEHLAAFDIFLIILDGRVPDEGACFALGYSYALGKRCVAYKTDVRTAVDGQDNVMIKGSCERILRNMDELQDFFQDVD